MIIMEMNKKICTAVYALFTAKSGFRFVCYTHKTNRIEQRFPTFMTRGALFRINFYGGAP